DSGAGLEICPGLAARPAEADRDPMNSTLDEPDRYRRLRELVDRAAEHPAAEWASFLERSARPTPPSGVRSCACWGTPRRPVRRASSNLPRRRPSRAP